MTIYYNDEGEVKSVICNSSMESDPSKGNALKDLAALWYFKLLVICLFFQFYVYIYLS